MHYQWGLWCKGSKFIWKAKKFNVKNIESTVQNILACVNSNHFIVKSPVGLPLHLYQQGTIF